jgi:thioredoxin reductase
VNTDVAIVGAGPYGLSLAAHLDSLGVSYRIFGSPMEFWQTSMPEGMSLKSEGCASSMYEPAQAFTLERYCTDQGLPYADLGLPVSLSTFIAYGLAFQQYAVPSLERVRVVSIKAEERGFSIDLDSGESLTARNVVIAVGVGYFAHVPDEIAVLPESVATHSSRHSDLSSFVDRDVAVVGGGASALDLAALLRRVGARPTVIARASDVQFHDRQRLPRTRLDRLRAPTSGIGPGWRSRFFCVAPLAFHFFPERWRLLQTKRHAGPSGGWFIKDAVLGHVPISVDSRVQKATIEGDRVVLDLAIGENQESHEIRVDHVIAATGFRVNIDRLSFLDVSLRNRIESVQKTPILNAHFESTVSGLYFVGPAAANSFGPVQRFAVGAYFAARRVARNLARAKS